MLTRRDLTAALAGAAAALPPGFSALPDAERRALADERSRADLPCAFCPAPAGYPEVLGPGPAWPLPVWLDCCRRHHILLTLLAARERIEIRPA